MFFDALLRQYGIFVGTHCPTACITAALASAWSDLAVGDVEVFLLLLLVDVGLTEVNGDNTEVDEPRADDNWTSNGRWCPWQLSSLHVLLDIIVAFEIVPGI